VKSVGSGWLFENVVGRVIHALSTHSDNLLVERFGG
jgi:hypothetical protein